jgi:hypothetical protein
MAESRIRKLLSQLKPWKSAKNTKSSFIKLCTQKRPTLYIIHDVHDHDYDEIQIFHVTAHKSISL